MDFVVVQDLHVLTMSTCLCCSLQIIWLQLWSLQYDYLGKQQFLPCSRGAQFPVENKGWCSKRTSDELQHVWIIFDPSIFNEAKMHRVLLLFVHLSNTFLFASISQKLFLHHGHTKPACLEMSTHLWGRKACHIYGLRFRCGHWDWASCQDVNGHSLGCFVPWDWKAGKQTNESGVAFSSLQKTTEETALILVGNVPNSE